MAGRTVHDYVGELGSILGVNLTEPKAAETEKRCGGANKHKPWIEAEYQGIVMENDNTVLLNPPLFALDKDTPLRYAGEICGFRIHGQGVPFEAVVLDKTTGEGLIRAKELMDCEAQKEHTFTIQAYDCGEGPDGANTKKSHKATVHVRVNDVNEFAPVFVEKAYRVAVSEGKLFERILRVEAIDGDCSPQYSQICYYEILTPNTPFVIDNDGNIKNTDKLEYRSEHLYRFTVTAYDCGKKRASEDTLVEIEVKPMCKPSWQGWTKRIEYTPGEGSMALFPSIHLETCEEPVWNIQTTIELQTNHVAKGCDRDNYSEKSLRKICGAATGTVDLLPVPRPSTNWTLGMSTHYSQDSSLIYWFNGTQAVRVPVRVSPDGLSDHFTVAFWMKHAMTGGKTRKQEETILCNTIRNVTDSRMSDEIVHNLDSCEVSLVGEELDLEKEVLILDRSLILQRGLELINTSAYLTISGVETIAVYEEILRQVRYHIKSGAALYERKFRLSCTEMNGRYASNEFTVEVNVLHSVSGAGHPNHVLTAQQFLHPAHHGPAELSGHNLVNTHRNSVVPSAATIIIIVCVGFLALMVVLGIFRIRSIHRRVSREQGGGKENEMFWDDSALTIIVNPMESYENRHGGSESEAEGERDDGSESETPDSPTSVPDNQMIMGKKERESVARRY
nr:PREDICTED: calsyntenin-3 [Latimeria chalumnae]|eukprot:XP_014354414.1 PREDICTED: calsyntenin-3 [Latimeria chalumnae]